ncbi:hypothetical protein [Yokenella regensburgei]|uniref:hypothetical protein n=1 Tax=Yokenella regensburgei TaxID=158877 RepID=UPI0013758AD1|nr:hypothetical protein [Yokenella regensburgei]KAF1366536.1 hypothetical protein FHR25_004999 [Yokenella regensburgei]
MPLTDEQKTDFNAPYRDGELTPVPVAKGELIPAGVIVCINASGYAVGGQAATGLIYAGRAEERADNSAGDNGSIAVLVRRKKAFRWLNDGTITQAMLGQRVFVLDNRTLTGTDGSSPASDDGKTPAVDASHSKAGTVILIESDGVWVE